MLKPILPNFKNNFERSPAPLYNRDLHGEHYELEIQLSTRYLQKLFEDNVE